MHLESVSARAMWSPKPGVLYGVWSVQNVLNRVVVCSSLLSSDVEKRGWSVLSRSDRHRPDGRLTGVLKR